MDRKLISQGSGFERDSGYSRAVVDGDTIHVSGTTGFDYTTMTISDGVRPPAVPHMPTWRGPVPCCRARCHPVAMGFQRDDRRSLDMDLHLTAFTIVSHLQEVLSDARHAFPLQPYLVPA